MPFDDKLKETQKLLAHSKLDGWLLYDFRRSNDLAFRFLEIPKEKMFTRRFFYWIPCHGQPTKLVHRIEAGALDHLPGKILTYSSWQELEEQLKKLLEGAKTIAMEYSPRNAIPYVSKVDAGTIELMRQYGIEVVSSADLLQRDTSVWSEEQLKSHLKAAEVLENAVTKAWHWIVSSVGQGKHVTEIDVQQMIVQEFEKHHCTCDHPPICAVNAHSADPHYSPDPSRETLIKPGDFVLIDLWCKKKEDHAVYADITRVGVLLDQPNEKQRRIFHAVKAGRDAALALLQDRLQKRASVMGWEVDKACRDSISKAGFGDYFTHRTGHSLGENVHGDGANIDNFETQDSRQLLPGTCFTIEPGIYLPGEFGVRLEHDVYIERDGRHMKVTGLQEKMMVIP